MPSEIAIPFGLDADNRIAVETLPNPQIRQHVMSLINTEPGERVVLGNYGIPLSDMLFEEDDEVVATDLAQDIRDALSTFEPGVALRKVAAESGREGDGLSVVDVEYLRTDAPDPSVESTSMNVAVITPGGKVSEVIRG